MLLNKQISIRYIFEKIRYEVLYIIVISALIQIIGKLYPDTLPNVPFPITAFLGTAISVLLSFKISQSYGRWWESRTAWSNISRASQMLVLHLQNQLSTENTTILRRIAYRQIGYCYSLGQTLRGLDPLAKLDKYFTATDRNALWYFDNKPFGILSQQAAEISELHNRGELVTYAYIQISNQLEVLSDSQSKAEQIKYTVFPATYRMFLHMFIYLFTFTLSLSFQQLTWYFETPVILLISMPFFLLERSATNMQNPFENRPTDTPVTYVANTVEINIRQLLKEEQVVVENQGGRFYIL